LWDCWEHVTGCCGDCWERVTGCCGIAGSMLLGVVGIAGNVLLGVVGLLGACYWVLWGCCPPCAVPIHMHCIDALHITRVSKESIGGD
jgi:hypothetical protein